MSSSLTAADSERPASTVGEEKAREDVYSDLVKAFALLPQTELKVLGRHYIENAYTYEMSNFDDAASGRTSSHDLRMGDFYWERVRILHEEYMGDERFQQVFGELLAEKRRQLDELVKETPPYGSPSEVM